MSTSTPRQKGRLGDRTALPRIGLPPSNPTAASRRSATQSRLRTAQALGAYTTSSKTNCNHIHILDVGADVEREIDAQHKKAQQIAIDNALQQERELNAEKLAKILLEKEEETRQRLEEQRVKLEEMNKRTIENLLIDQEKQEKKVVAKTIEQWKSFQHLAVEAEKNRSVREYAKEKHLFGVELSNKLRKELSVEQESAVSAALKNANRDHRKNLKQQLEAQRAANDQELASRETRFKNEISQYELQLHELKLQLAEQKTIAERSIEAQKAAEAEKDRIKEDYRRTLALKLPNYSADQSWLI
eukprot:m.160893 g.160893  ORF g.160893 m.160893 type:complete len:302 (-) comp18042_c0_seq1:766-1671(-)